MPKILKFNLLLINLIKNLKYMYIQISIDHMTGFMCHGILKCVNFDAEIGLLTGKDFRFRSFPAIWSALFGSDNFLLSTEYIQESGLSIRAKVKDYDKKST